jgi:hypothetical protein
LSIAFGSKYLLTSDSFCSILYLHANPEFHATVEQIGETFSLREDRAKDPLFDVVELLESNCKNARMVLQNTRHALTRLFGIFFPKKNDELPQNSRKLVEAFNTPEDPTLLLKRSSTRRGTEATIALAMSHGEVVDWTKVRSSLAQDESSKPVGMKGFFAEAKKYSQNLVFVILLVPTLSNTAPSSSATPVVNTTTSEVA